MGTCFFHSQNKGLSFNRQLQFNQLIINSPELCKNSCENDDVIIIFRAHANLINVTSDICYWVKVKINDDISDALD